MFLYHSLVFQAKSRVGFAQSNEVFVKRKYIFVSALATPIYLVHAVGRLVGVVLTAFATQHFFAGMQQRHSL